MNVGPADLGMAMANRSIRYMQEVAAACTLNPQPINTAILNCLRCGENLGGPTLRDTSRKVKEHIYMCSLTDEDRAWVRRHLQLAEPLGGNT